MKPDKLKRHLEAKHKELKNKHADFFQRRAENLKIQSANLKKFTTIPQNALRASLEVSYLIGKTMKSNTIGESLILPAATKMTSIMHGDKYGNELKTIPLSRDTVSRRISEMSRNIESEVIKRIQNSSVFALQLGETTNITKMSQLIIYARTKGLIQKVAPHMVFNHCMIYRQALVAKDMDEELHNTYYKTLLVQLTTLNATVLTAFQYFAMRWAQRRRDYCYTPKSDGFHVGKYYDGYWI
ncbi:zinc finger MYM-type protein 6 [Trichonephila clavipes]|nr:zinc finger MYM-type protein 6 [Trichonephila clavipes]